VSTWDNGCEYAYASGDGGLAYGISAGYEYQVNPHFALALEAVFRRGAGGESSSAMRVFGIQIVGILYF
jgi:hypothetical protein